jgi:hypothetical protein
MIVTYAVRRRAQAALSDRETIVTPKKINAAGRPPVCGDAAIGYG